MSIMHPRLLALLLAMLLAACAAPERAPSVKPMSATEGRALVARYIPARISDREGWAADIYGPFASLRIEPSPANICAAIAVIEQESGWQSDPAVPNLPKAARQEIDALREKAGIPRLAVTAALALPSTDGRSYDQRLEVHGAVKTPFTLDYAQLLKLPQTEQAADVHCVTGWSLLGSLWKGVTVALLAERAGVKGEARHVIFEAAHGFTANVPLAEATRPGVMVTYRVDGKPFATPHGAPVRALVPDLYFWKSAKWLTGIKFVTRDEPGFWEVRGYHNHADPWREERYG